ncbi:hypothetical protein A2U01_0055395 [Trifolium medium]|uniref:Uncharacterized protein n=1 Tax=Trifolium medium TaxID=97028 RepID=A0A392RDA2_9FABA|nr:hypothetical protein [Trifolium medium]
MASTSGDNSSPDFEPSSNLEVSSPSEPCPSKPLSIDEEILVLVETLKSTLQEDMDFIVSRYHEVVDFHETIEGTLPL